MPNGFWYASGPKEMDERIAGSAFSKGDVLALDSNSSLSRLNPYALTTAALYAVACADSTDSIRNLVPAIVIQPTTRFWSATTSGVTLVTGEESGVSFTATKPGRYWVDESTSTNMVVVVEGTAKIDQSVQSKVIVQFKFADSEHEFA
jgi:hypothetical protein